MESFQTLFKIDYFVADLFLRPFFCKFCSKMLFRRKIKGLKAQRYVHGEEFFVLENRMFQEFSKNIRSLN